MRTTINVDLRRPAGWAGEPSYLTREEAFEVTVEGDAIIEIDSNYGADADGNRGMPMDFSYVEDITITLEGDFRPLSRKVRDLFFGIALGNGVPWYMFRYNQKYRFKTFSDDILTSREFEEIQEKMLEKADEAREPRY